MGTNNLESITSHSAPRRSHAGVRRSVTTRLLRSTPSFSGGHRRNKILKIKKLPLCSGHSAIFTFS
jgi:hypothetical protein